MIDARLAGLKVLVVEDHPFQRRALVRVLHGLGVARVSEAEDGSHALRCLAAGAETFDTVITDLDMPSIDGMALMREIGRMAPQVSIILLSAVEREVLGAVEWLAREQHINLAAALAKPVSAATLRAALARAAPARSARKATMTPASIEAIAAGLAAGQFEAFLQPKLRFSDGCIAGGEALARWRHPDLGWVAPAAFIPAIETSELIEPFSLAIVESLAWAVRWMESSGLPGRIAFNASPAWLDQPAMAEGLFRTIARLGLPVGRLTVEVTEGVSYGDFGVVMENLARLRMRGFMLSVDDYGTGYSSLGRLVRSPFSELKLDGSFVSDLEPGTPHCFVVESTIELARKLGLSTVAEGIETANEWELLKNAGCDFGQGYFIAKPMGRSDFMQWAGRRMQAFSPAAVAA